MRVEWKLVATLHQDISQTVVYNLMERLCVLPLACYGLTFIFYICVADCSWTQFLCISKKRKATNNKIVKYKEFTKKVFIFPAVVIAKEQKRHNSISCSKTSPSCFFSCKTTKFLVCLSESSTFWHPPWKGRYLVQGIFFDTAALRKMNIWNSANTNFKHSLLFLFLLKCCDYEN